jgi:opine dehydrogenase
MSLEPIVVLGGGHGAHAMAADITLAGYQVRLCEHPQFEEQFAPTLRSGEIELHGIGRTGRARPAMLTTDFAAALEGAKLINLSIPAFGHDLFFESMLPYLSPEHVVVVWAGDFGSLRLAHMIAERPGTERPVILEGSTLPYGTRLSGPARVEMLLFANPILVAALPASQTGTWPDQLRELWPGVRPALHALHAAFANPNPIVHPPGALLSVGRIEYSGGDFFMYREGMGPATRRVIHRSFQEIEAVALALGFELSGYADDYFDRPASIMGEVFECPGGDRYEVIANVKGPKTLQDRYLTEDLPCGLLPISQLGDMLGVQTPTVDAIIQFGSIVCEHDFWQEGRSLSSIGLEGRSPDEIMAYVTGAGAGPAEAPAPDRVSARTRG